MIDHAELRLSAQSAFLGGIYPEMRLIKIKAEGTEIFLTVILDMDATDVVREAVSIAASEIIADFPQSGRIVETIDVCRGPLAKENVLTEGWVYRRAE